MSASIHRVGAVATARTERRVTNSVSVVASPASAALQGCAIAGPSMQGPPNVAADPIKILRSELPLLPGSSSPKNRRS